MSKNKIFILLFVVFNIFWLNIYANNNENTESLKKANKLYAEEKYEEATAIYSKILESDYESATLYFNLANSYYRLNDLGSSIYYYEKAKMLAPDNEDIKYNSKIAELMVYNKPTPIPQIGIVKFYNNFIISQNINTWAWFSLGLFALAISFAVWFIIAKTSQTKKISFTFGVISLIFSSIAFAFMHKQYSFIYSTEKAVIFCEKTEIKSSPDEKSTLLFEVFEGYKVTIADDSGVWYKIILEDGKQGWIKKDKLRVL